MSADKSAFAKLKAMLRTAAARTVEGLWNTIGRIIGTLALEMSIRGVRYGIASACIGGGMGIAVLLENAQV